MKSLAIFAAVFLCASLVAQAKIERRQEEVNCATASAGWSPTTTPPESCLPDLFVIATITEDTNVTNLTPEQTSALMGACISTCIGDLCNYQIEEELWDCAEGLDFLCSLPQINQTQSTCDACSVVGEGYPEELTQQCIDDLETLQSISPFAGTFTEAQAQALVRSCTGDCFGAVCTYFRDEDANTCADGIATACYYGTNMSLACDASPTPSSTPTPSPTPTPTPSSTPTPTPTTDGSVAILTGAVPAFLGLAALLGAFFRA